MRRTMSLPTLLLAGALAIPFAATNLMAAPPPPRTTGRSQASGGVGVARLTAAAGDVQRRHGGVNDVSRANSGTALVGGDSLITGSASRAEVRLDPSNFVRLDENTEIRFRELGERSYQIDVIRGDASYSMMRGGEADVDLRLPNANVVPSKDGIYRVDVASNTKSTVIVRKGQADVLTPSKSTTVKKNKSVAIEGNEQATQTEIASAPGKDAFDAWNQRRDKILEKERGPVYARGGWYPGRVHLGFGWGPYWGPYWGSYWGSYGGFYNPIIIAPRGGFDRDFGHGGRSGRGSGGFSHGGGRGGHR